jgi:hypothetical protein
MPSKTLFQKDVFEQSGSIFPRLPSDPHELLASLRENPPARANFTRGALLRSQFFYKRLTFAEHTLGPPYARNRK